MKRMSTASVETDWKQRKHGNIYIFLNVHVSIKKVLRYKRDDAQKPSVVFVLISFCQSFYINVSVCLTVLFSSYSMYLSACVSVCLLIVFFGSYISYIYIDGYILYIHLLFYLGLILSLYLSKFYVCAPCFCLFSADPAPRADRDSWILQRPKQNNRWRCGV